MQLPADDATLLLLDALDRTMAHPAGGHCWINLMAQTQALALTNPAALVEVAGFVRSRLPDSGLPGFYRAAYLDIISADLGQAAQAVAHLAHLQPRDQDRMAAYFHVCWQRALLRAADRPEFERNLRSMGTQTLTRMIGFPATGLMVTRSPSANVIRRVAIVGPLLLSPRHPPTRMLLDLATVLARCGMEVKIYSSQEAIVPDSAHLLGQSAISVAGTVDIDACREVLAQNVAITVSDHRYSLMRRWHDMLRLIDSESPDLVILVGLHSGLIDNLYQRYPVLGLATNSVAPLAATDVWLTAQPALHGTVSDYWQSGQPASQAYYHPFRARRRACAAAIPRQTLGIPEDALLLISVGNRLPDLIKGPWAARMGALMQRWPQLHWLLLGGHGQLPPALNGLAAGRLHTRAHAEQVMEIMAGCDIYLNPPMMGGGLSVSEAMSLGLPVASLAHSDGGDKLGGMAAPDEDAYFTQLEQWIVDPAARAAAGASLRRHFDSAIDLAQSGPSLLAACELARQRFLQRCTAPR